MPTSDSYQIRGSAGKAREESVATMTVAGYRPPSRRIDQVQPAVHDPVQWRQVVMVHVVRPHGLPRIIGRLSGNPEPAVIEHRHAEGHLAGKRATLSAAGASSGYPRPP